MFGVGRDAGQTTIRLRHAWGQWKQIGAGQTNSQFMDVDVFPNILEYWGPNGMLFFRNVQVFWEPFNDGTSNARIAIEAPGRQRRCRRLRDRIELQNVTAALPGAGLHRPLPLSAATGATSRSAARSARSRTTTCSRRRVRPERTRLGLGLQPQLEHQGRRRATCCGCRSSTARASRTTSTTRRSTSASRATRATRSRRSTARRCRSSATSRTSITTGTTGGRRAIGYSRVGHRQQRRPGADAFKIGQYASANLLYAPVKNVMMGGEFQWAHRENFSDGFTSDDFRLQFSFKYSFSHKVGG